MAALQTTIISLSIGTPYLLTIILLKFETVHSTTENPLYMDARYNDKIHHNVNLNVTKPLLKR